MSLPARTRPARRRSRPRAGLPSCRAFLRPVGRRRFACGGACRSSGLGCAGIAIWCASGGRSVVHDAHRSRSPACDQGKGHRGACGGACRSSGLGCAGIAIWCASGGRSVVHDAHRSRSPACDQGKGHRGAEGGALGAPSCAPNRTFGAPEASQPAAADGFPGLAGNLARFGIRKAPHCARLAAFEARKRVARDARPGETAQRGIAGAGAPMPNLARLPLRWR